MSLLNSWLLSGHQTDISAIRYLWYLGYLTGRCHSSKPESSSFFSPCHTNSPLSFSHPPTNQVNSISYHRLPSTIFFSLDSCGGFWLGSPHTVLTLHRLFSPQHLEGLLAIKLPQGSSHPWTAKNAPIDSPWTFKEMKTPPFSPHGGSCVLP